MVNPLTGIGVKWVSFVTQNYIFYGYQRVPNFKKKLNKKNQSLTKKNSETYQTFPETEQFFFGWPKKMRNRPDNWLTKRLTKTTWTGLVGRIQWSLFSLCFQVIFWERIHGCVLNGSLFPWYIVKRLRKMALYKEYNYLQKSYQLDDFWIQTFIIINKKSFLAAENSWNHLMNSINASITKKP